jgi:hypothetical protein
MLALHSSNSLRDEGRLPQLREIEFRIERRSGGSLITLTLLDAAKADLFRVLCCDLVDAVGGLSSDQVAVQRLMERAYRWHHLLRSGGKRLLSEREQRGLFAELLVLREIAFPAIGVALAVEAWRGPYGEHQDFRIRGHRLEVKSTDSAGPRAFGVNSEYQLDLESVEGDAVSLALVELATADSAAGDGESLVEIVGSVRGSCDVAGSRTRSELEQRLLAAGYADEHAYEAVRWSSKPVLVVTVDSEFPAIRASLLPAGISAVRYECDLGGHRIRVADAPFGVRRGGCDVS